jgi:hypothetical protein
MMNISNKEFACQYLNHFLKTSLVHFENCMDSSITFHTEEYDLAIKQLAEIDKSKYILYEDVLSRIIYNGGTLYVSNNRTLIPESSVSIDSLIDRVVNSSIFELNSFAFKEKDKSIGCNFLYSLFFDK